MDNDSEIRKKEAEVAALPDEAARIVGAASMQGRQLTTEDDARVLALPEPGALTGRRDPSPS
jgi:hypothetical protein